MLYGRVLVSIVLVVGCFIIHSLYTSYRSQVFLPIFINKSIQHTAIILARRPSIKIFYHLNSLLNVGVNAFVMCDERPSKYMIMTERVLYVSDQSLAQYGMKRNLVWDRVFIWLYNQSSLDYVWLMEDDLTWISANHMVNLFNQYAHNRADLLARNIIYKDHRAE